MKLATYSLTNMFKVELDELFPLVNSGVTRGGLVDTDGFCPIIGEKKSPLKFLSFSVGYIWL